MYDNNMITGLADYVMYLLHNTDSEIASQIFTEKLQSTISDISVKMKCRYKKQSLPWVNDNIKKLMKECDNALKLATRFKYIKYSFFFFYHNYWKCSW